jgi:signal transduction histidine kinase
VFPGAADDLRIDMSAVGLASAIFGAWYEVSADSAFAIDRAAATIACGNARFAATLGREPESLPGTPLRDLLHDPQDAGELLATFGHRDHVAFRHSGGGVAYISLELSSISHLGHGELIACLGRDTTAARRLELERLANHSQLSASHGGLAQLVEELSDAKLQLEERNHEIGVLAGQVSRFGWRAAVGELIAGIAHHLNNPIGALASTLRRLDTLVAAVAEPDVRAQFERLVQRSRDICLRIEGNVNAVARAHEAGIADPARRWLVLHRELETALSMFADRLERVMVVRDYGDEPPVLVPHDALHLVISNLIDNSLRAMGETGTLRISVRRKSEEVAVQISDTGAGVPSEILPRLFEPILSARAGGAGLGLSTAQRLARAWGGDLVHLPADSGCTFEIRIPVSKTRDTGAGRDPTMPLSALQLRPLRDPQATKDPS